MRGLGIDRWTDRDTQGMETERKPNRDRQTNRQTNKDRDRDRQTQ